MPNIIKHKKNSVAGTVPATGVLDQAELAINIADGKFYTKNSSNVVINLGVSSISGAYITPASGLFSNNVTASGFVRSGGTSSQFLKADGSIDSSSYQTSLTNPVTGVGTSGYLSKWTSSSAISSGIIFDNGTNVGISTASPTYKLQVNGSFAASTKSFRINHPSKKDHSLEYGSLESPYHGVRLTGRDKVIKGVGTVSLPVYLKDLIHDDDTLNIQITNIKHGKTIYIDKIDLKNDQFIVKADRSKTLGELEFFWTLSGVRKDVDHLVVEKRN